MPEFEVACGAATGRPDPERLTFNVDGRPFRAELRISRFRRTFLAELPDILADLLEVAAYVYAADAAIRRGGPAARQMGAAWRRELRITVPVRCRDRWEDDATRSLLEETLGFLSDDTYHFAFEDHDGRPVSETLPFDFSEDESWQPDRVLMFSGGLDSYSGAVEAIVEGQHKVALVSHSAAQTMTKTQRELAERLTKKTSANRVRHFPVAARMLDRGLREGTHRSRSFLFAALGIAFARSFGLNRVDFHENGIVSLNLPLLAQYVGARATRSTHPQALARLGRLFSGLTGEDLSVGNPQFWRTKTEVVKRISDLGFAEEIPHTRSCAKVRAATKMTPHCGRCSQCIDRRFAMIAAGLEAHDPGIDYAVDLLSGDRRSEDRELVLAYVRMARRYRAIDGTRFLLTHPELTRALAALDLDTDASLERLAELYRRHGQAVTGVMEDALRMKTGPPGSLLELYKADDDMAPAAQDARTTSQKVLIEIDEQGSVATLDARLSIKGAQFVTLSSLVKQHLAELGTGKAPEDYAALHPLDLLEMWDVTEESTVRRRISDLKRTIEREFGKEAAEIVETVNRYGYRLRPECVTVRVVQRGDRS